MVEDISAEYLQGDNEGHGDAKRRQGSFHPFIGYLTGTGEQFHYL
jgi:hypothetical protein